MDSRPSLLGRDDLPGAASTERDPRPRRSVNAVDPRAPYGAYGVILGSFAGALAATAAVERALGREEQLSPLDLVVLCGATFKGARAISRERVGGVLREPFVETEPVAASDAPEVEHPAGSGLRRAVGELVTCTRCVGTWTAAGLVASHVVAPRFGRLLTVTLAAGAANDFLQAGFAALCERANRTA